VKLEDIQQLWQQDSNIDRTNLAEESLKIPLLHSKYFNMLSAERLLLKKLRGDYDRLIRLKHEYYLGSIAQEDLRANEWEPFQLKVLRSDLNIYIDSDTDIQQIKMRIQIQEEKVEFLESAIKSLSVRGYQIKAAIEWTRFQMGG
jgi:hypothetical protein